jgi:hypothetical protein
MRWQRTLGLGLALLVSGTAARAQAPAAPRPTDPPTYGGTRYYSVIPVQATNGTPGTPAPVVQEESRQAERMGETGEAPAGPKYGPTPPEDVKLFGDLFGHKDSCKKNPIRVYGWGDFGYTYSSTGPGLLSVEPRENRFGNEFLVNELAVVVEKPLDPKELSFGFNATFYAGADAALLRPEGGFTTTDPRFGADFRQLFVSAHLPVITEGGMDVKAGRMGTVIGYESALAPYRPFYSNDYQWFYSQDGAFTGILTNLHVSKQLDVINAVTLGANTFFTLRGDSPCYLGQVNYWLSEEKKTLVSTSVYLGNNAIFAAPGLAGDFDTVVELRLQHNWSDRFTTILQSDDGWDSNVPGIGTGSWYSAYLIAIYHVNEKVDLGLRPEWFYDVQGTRTGIKNNYEEVTFNVNYHPTKFVEFRPEIRGDFASNRPAFGRNADQRSQLTMAFEMLLKF